MDLLGLIEEIAYSSIVVESIDNVSNVFAHINLAVPFSCKKLRSSVNKVSGEDLSEYAVSVSLIHIFKTIAEQTEGCEYEDTLSALILELLAYVDNRISGGYHIVDNDNVLAVNVSSEILVSNYGVLAVYKRFRGQYQ